MPRRTRNLFDPHATQPFRLSRTKIELFLSCPRCFYLDRRLGIGRPDGPSMSLNLAVDALLKREFDLCRAEGEAHAIMKTFGLDAIPYAHPSLPEWRDAMRGVRYLDEPSRFLVFGAVDDVWINPEGELLVVDYKATSTSAEITLEGRWKGGYKRQLEVYQWLLRRNGFRVSPTGYFVFVNADGGRESFNGRLEFATTVLPYEGRDEWIDDALLEARICLCRESPPQSNAGCEWCEYRREAGGVEVWARE